jgi:ribokinase
MGETRKFDVVAIGSATIDLLAYSKLMKEVRIFESEETEKMLCVDYDAKVDVDQMNVSFGGSACNIAVTLQRLGRRTAVICKLGDGLTADMIEGNLEREGIDISGTSRADDARSGISVNLVSQHGEKSLLVYRGANDLLKKGDVNPEIIKNSKMLVFTSLSSESAADTGRRAVDIARKNGVRIAAAPSMSMVRKQKDKLKEMVQSCEVVIMNTKEMRGVTGKSSLESAMKELYSWGVRVVVATRGARGSMAYTGNGIIHQDIYKVDVVDTNGSGDAFSGGFLYAYLEGMDVKDCLDFASKVAALKLQKSGAERGLPTLEEVKAFKGKA